jgi:hypothetical protein
MKMEMFFRSDAFMNSIIFLSLFNQLPHFLAFQCPTFPLRTSATSICRCVRFIISTTFSVETPGNKKLTTMPPAIAPRAIRLAMSSPVFDAAAGEGCHIGTAFY